MKNKSIPQFPVGALCNETMKINTLLLPVVLMSTTSFGAIKTETIEYKQGDTTLEGYLAYDTKSSATAASNENFF